MNRPVVPASPPSPSAPMRHVPVPATPLSVAVTPTKNPSVTGVFAGKSPLPPRKSLMALVASVSTLCWSSNRARMSSS